jgi:hypothetical protein
MAPHPPTNWSAFIHFYNQNKKKNVSYVFNSSPFGLGDVWLISAQFSLPSQTPFHFPYNTQVNNVLFIIFISPWVRYFFGRQSREVAIIQKERENYSLLIFLFYNITIIRMFLQGAIHH